MSELASPDSLEVFAVCLSHQVLATKLNHATQINICGNLSLSRTFLWRSLNDYRKTHPYQ